MNWPEFIESDWVWAAAAVAVALAALVGSLATFIGSAISRHRNRPEPEWDITFEEPHAGTDRIWDPPVGNRSAGQIVNIGDGTAFQIRMTSPDGEALDLQVNASEWSKTVPVMRTGDSVQFEIVTKFDVWENADSTLSWVSPPTRLGKGGKIKMRPYRYHPKPVPVFKDEEGNVTTRGKWDERMKAREDVGSSGSLWS